jgi:hypothetical protein
MDKIILIQAAMFAAIGSTTKFSRNGYSVVFVEPRCGRHDLSGDEARALAQTHAAGLDIEAVTPEQVANYQEWHGRMYEERRISQARILITRKFSLQRGRELIPANCVRMVDGWGNQLGDIAVPCREAWDASARNAGGGIGAFCSEPDYAEIQQAIAQLQTGHPDLSGAMVQDNNA